jgi:hypothetical protein
MKRAQPAAQPGCFAAKELPEAIVDAIHSTWSEMIEFARVTPARGNPVLGQFIADG